MCMFEESLVLSAEIGSMDVYKNCWTPRIEDGFEYCEYVNEW